MPKRPASSKTVSKSKKSKIDVQVSKNAVSDTKCSENESLIESFDRIDKTKSSKKKIDQQPNIEITIIKSEEKIIQSNNEKSKRSRKNVPKDKIKKLKNELDIESDPTISDSGLKKDKVEEKQIPTKPKKINKKLNVEIEDPSSLVKSEEHQYPFTYKGITYYCKYLPENFQEQWNGICKMRETNDAPVDTMGASKLANRNEEPATQRFQTLVSIMLSSQTKDEKVSEAMNNLKQYGLTIESMIKIESDKLLELIRSVGFNKSKVKYIKETAQILHDKYDSDVPRTKAEIQSLPGCGPKVTNLAMWCCWDEITGLAVDTHMERIFSKRLKWSQFEKSEKQMKDIESWMPKAMWAEVNEKIVGFGQTICSAKSPQCGQCLIKNTCDFYINNF